MLITPKAVLRALVPLCTLLILSGPVRAAVPAYEQRTAERAPIANVIFDTDIWSDVDDTLALAMLHALHDRHEINLVAVTISTEEPSCATYVDVVDTFYHHPDVPIGLVRHGIGLEAFRKRFPPASNWPVTRYTQLISQETKSDGPLLYPRSLSDGSSVPEALSLLRKTLAAQPDRSVVIIEVGYHTNLARLLMSKGDAASPLSGVDLIAKKVRLLSVMAGRFAQTQDNGQTVPKETPEFNLMVDIPAAQTVFSTWPTPIVDSGFETGVAMPYPGGSIRHDFAYVPHHPISDTYTLYCNEMKARDARIKQCPEGHDHATFDLTAVLYAARPDDGYFSLSPPGTISVLPDGGSRFTESPGGKHRYLILSESQRARTLEAMRMLVSQPPVAH